MYRPLGGEIAWWCPSLDDAGNGTATLDDLIGSNNGTLTSMDPATDWVADTANGGVRALDFDGVNDEVRAQAPVISTTYCVSVWVKPTTGAGAGLVTLSADPNNLGADLYLNPNGTVVFYCPSTNNGSARSFFTTTNPVTSGQWVHIVGRWQAGAINDVWINGVQAAGTLTGTIQNTLTTRTTLALGGRQGIPDRLFGQLDDARCFTRLLTQTEITALASQRGFQLPQGLGGEIAWWCPTLDTTSFGSGEAIDLSGNGRIATVQNWTTEGAVRYITRLTAANFALSNTYTWSRWVYLTSPSNNAPIHGFNDTNNRVACLICTGALGDVYTQQGTLANMFQTWGNASVGINTWRHIAFRLINTSGTNFTSTVWLDGIQVGSVSSSGTLRTTLTAFTTFQSGISTPAPQRIDDFRLYNRSLSDAEIALLASTRGYRPSFNTRRRRYAGAHGL